MQLKKINIINGSSTDVGKTHFVCNIIKYYFELCKQINFIKPVSSGFDYNDLQNTDAGKMLIASGLSASLEKIKTISPFILKTPVSPNIASAIESINIKYEDVLNFCINKVKQDTPLIIEMSGGLCTPITHQKTMLDLTIDLKNIFGQECQNFFVTSNYLGGISHTISACKLFQFDKIIFNPITKTEFDEEIKQTIKEFTLVPLGGIEPPRA